MLSTDATPSSGALGPSLAALLLLAPLPAASPAAATAAYTFSTYLGGGNAVGSDRANAVAADGSGNVYVVGATSGSTDFPTTPGVVQPASAGGDDVWVAKFDPAGTLLVATLIGGSNNDGPLAVAVDAAGAVYVAGTTTSIDFPTTAGAIQTVFGGGSDAFVVKLAPDFGSIVYATYLGGSGAGERASGIAVDGAGYAFVTGQSPSSDFPTTPGAYDTTCGTGTGCTPFTEDAFVAKLDPAGASLVYSSFLGGDKRDFGSGIAIDAAGRAYVTGSTLSSDFPVTAGAFDTSYAASHDGFAVRLSAAGDALEHATYLGGSKSDIFVGIALDAAGDLYLGGYTSSSDFPVTAGAFDTVCGSSGCAGELDAFAMKLRLDGSAPIYATYLGGDRRDFGFGLAVDDDGQLHLAGTTNSADFPIESPIQGSIASGPACALDAFGIEIGPPCSDLWVAKLAADGATLLFSDVVGGTDGESRVAWPSFQHSLALDGAGAVTIAGTSFSTDYPTANAHQTALLGGNDAVVTRLGGLPGSDTVPPTADAGPNQAIHAGDAVVLDGAGSFDDNTATIDLLYTWVFAATPAGSAASLFGAATASPSFVADLPGAYLVALVVTDEAGLVSAPDTVEISSLNVTPVADAGLDRIVVVDDVVALDGSGSSDVDGDPLTYAWALDAAPAGSLAAIVDPSSVTATLQPDAVGAYTVSLTVHDGFASSAPDTVEITATTAEALAESKLAEACDLVTALPVGLFDAPGHRNALCNFMAQAIRHLDDGQLARAISKADDAIERTDGCHLGGAPDPKGAQGADWILGCAAQEDVYALLQSARDALDPAP